MRGAGWAGRSLLADVRKGVQVVREDATGRHAGADPAVALLLLRVHPQHVPPLPHIVILRAHDALWQGHVRLQLHENKDACSLRVQAQPQPISLPPL